MLDRASKTFFHLLAGSAVLKKLASRYGMRKPTSFARRFIAGEAIEAAIEAAALSDPDNKPRTPEREKKLRRIPQVRVMRKALGLTQEEFASHFHIPLGTLRDWEQGKSEPDTCARAYLKVIARNPKAVTDALETTP